MIFENRPVAVFDLEIKKRIEDCTRGWQSHDEMGVSVLCIFDYQEMRYRFFDESNITNGIALLHEREFVAGFNTVGFDWKVLNSFNPLSTKVSKDYDILREIWIALGLDPDNFNFRTHGGYKLDDVAYNTIGISKTGSGEHAPKLYQEGRIAELYDYVTQDVKVEKELFEFAIKYGYVVRNSREIQLDVPLELRKML